jgi:hypothetical protein
MCLDLMRFDVHFRVKDHKFLLQALPIWTQKVVFLEVNLERVIVDKVLLLSAAITPVADVAAFVFVSAMCVQFVISIEALSAETAFWMSLEATLIDRARVVVAKLLMFLQFRVSEQLVFVGEDLLVSRAEIAIRCQLM